MKKLVFVTGAGRGIGQAIALKLSEAGFTVSACARTQSQLNETKKLSQNQVRVLNVDVTDYKAVTRWIENEIAETSSNSVPWGLITSAGIHGPIGPFTECNLEDWRKAIETNLYGSLIATQVFTKHLIRNKISGRVIYLSGGGATLPQPGLSSYGASKAALVRFGETLSHELKNFGITVNSVAPGSVNTHLTDDLLAAGPEKLGHEVYQKISNQKKKGGVSPDHAASLCLFLLSEEAKNITGRLISAIWDPWKTFEQRSNELASSDIYTLRRIVPADRNKDWSK